MAVFLKRASDIEAGIEPQNEDEMDADSWFKSQSPAPARIRQAGPSSAATIVEPRSKLADAALAAFAVSSGFMAAVVVAGFITTAVSIGVALA